LNVFNHNSCLIQGRQKVRFWPTETNNNKITLSMYGFNERALAGLFDFDEFSMTCLFLLQ